MLRNSFHRFFPPPEFLSRPSFGLDISDESIKYVSLNVTDRGVRLGKYGEKKIESGIIESGKIKDPSKLAIILTELRKKEGIKSVRVSLPEEQVYLFRLSLEKEGLESIREAIELSLEEHIPIPASESIFDYAIIGEDSKFLRLQVAAVPQNVIETYLSVLKSSGIEVQALELEAQAISRAVIHKNDKGTYMIVDFGEKRTGIFIVSSGVTMFTSTLDLGGAMLNSMIAKNFNISTEEAEAMKRNYGLKRNTENKEIFAVLLNSVSVLRDEVSKHFLYWQTHEDDNGKKNPPIKSIILCGGDSNLIGLPDYFSVSMKCNVDMANVWANILDTNKEVPVITFKQALSFATAIGLALGDFEND